MTRQNAPPLGGLLEPLAEYARSRKGGAMLVTGVFVLLLMVVSGSAMTNYAWREAQWEELRAASRAAVSAAGPLLAGAGTVAGNRQISERVAEFLSAVQPGLRVDASDVDVSRGANDVVTVRVKGSYTFDSIWLGSDDGSQAETVTTSVRVRYEVDRYEVAVAVDVSPSMGFSLSGNVTKLDALKTAFLAVADAIEPINRANPGTMMVSLVPFAGAVNVADTCAPNGAGQCTNARTAGKERYVRMLAGARDTMAQTLADARDAVTANERVHWVDTFRNYGISRNSSLNHRHLPSGVLNDTDWNLRRTDVDIDVSSDVPSMGTWTVDDEDFWYGCVMARWGAYWNAAARPTPWDPADTANWPATATVAGWSPLSAALPASTPLHLSDEPPEAANPNSLFTAYSWPDARIGEGADEKLQGAMIETMFPGEFVGNYGHSDPFIGDVHWSRGANSGRILCPPSPIVPLTDDIQELRDVTAALQTVDAFRRDSNGFVGSYSTTLVVRGVVWAMRALSPLWQSVWDVEDAANRTRPGRPCAIGEGTGCDGLLRKSILLITDGATEVGTVGNASLLQGELPSPTATTNPYWGSQTLCNSPPGSLTSYLDATIATDEVDFNRFFRAGTVGTNLVDASGELNAAGRRRVAEAFLAMEGNGDDCSSEATRCASMEAALLAENATPWELFRSLDADVVDELVKPTGAFDVTGRPTVHGRICKPLSTFGVYGRVDDLVDVGGDVVEGASPYETLSLDWRRIGNRRDIGRNQLHTIRARVTQRVDHWLDEACRLAGLRRVRVNAIYIGSTRFVSDRGAIADLERCVDAAGGTPGVDEVHVLPTPSELRETVVNLFTVRRNLRFVD